MVSIVHSAVAKTNATIMVIAMSVKTDLPVSVSLASMGLLAPLALHAAGVKVATPVLVKVNA